MHSGDALVLVSGVVIFKLSFARDMLRDWRRRNLLVTARLSLRGILRWSKGRGLFARCVGIARCRGRSGKWLRPGHLLNYTHDRITSGWVVFEIPGVSWFRSQRTTSLNI
ncbi:hypothetical protein DL95DRAFT_399518 [Leptodontidium sp. 2 PMI_412]|nr:hypothetical protein DL95DRAFT_399518 [Leptodontidium sp. 2 PMI_412]